MAQRSQVLLGTKIKLNWKLLTSVLSVLTGMACAFNVEPGMAQFAARYNYSFNSATLANAKNVSVPLHQACAFKCASLPDCFAASYDPGSLTCSLLQSCIRVVLISSKLSVTYTLIVLQPSAYAAILDMPIMTACGLWSQFGSATFSVQPALLMAKTTSLITSPWINSSAVLYFSKADYLTSLNATGYLIIRDTVSRSFDVFSSGSSFTVSFAFLLTTARNAMCILSFVTSNGDLNCFWADYISCSTPNGYCMRLAYAHKCDATATWQTTLAAETNTWYHVAFVYDSNQRQLYLYLNGKSKLSQSFTLPATTKPVDSIFIGNDNHNCYSMQGFVMCVQLYNKLFSMQQAKSLYWDCISGSLVITD